MTIWQPPLLTELLDRPAFPMIAESGPLAQAGLTGRHGWKPPLPVAEREAGKPACRASGRKPYFRYPARGVMG